MSKQRIAARLEWARRTTCALRGLLDVRAGSKNVEQSASSGALEALTIPAFSTSSGRQDDDGLFEPLNDEDVEYLQLGIEGYGALTVSSDEHFSRADFAPDAGDSIESRKMIAVEESEGDANVWLKVGGGLAVFGAMVGGVALVVAQSAGQVGDDNGERRRRHGNNQCS